MLAVIAAAAWWFGKPYWVAKPAAQAAYQAEIHKDKLANGLEIVVLPNHRVPAVSHTLWFRVGAADDPEGQSGLAHFVEHMMFKGTPTVPEGEYSQIIQRLGGNHNAFTGRDFTAYYVNIAKDHLARVMELEADRWQHLSPSKSGFEKEREVIIEERFSRIENNPSALLAEQMNAMQFLHHPYRKPVIGWKHEMQQLNAEQVGAFIERYYQPKNALLVVAGDITLDELRPLAQQYYGGLASGADVQRQWLDEPPQRSERSVRVRHALVKQPIWRRTYVAPSLSHGASEHAVPAALLAHMMGTGKGSIFYQKLVVEQKLASGVAVYYSPLALGPSTLTIHVTPAPGIALETVERSVDTLLSNLDSHISAAHMERSKTKLKAETIFAQDSLEGIARYVGYLRMSDLPADYLHGWPQALDAVTRAQLLDAAALIIKPRRSVTGYLLQEDDNAPVE